MAHQLIEINLSIIIAQRCLHMPFYESLLWSILSQPNLLTEFGTFDEQLLYIKQWKYVGLLMKRVQWINTTHFFALLKYGINHRGV